MSCLADTFWFIWGFSSRRAFRYAWRVLDVETETAKQLFQDDPIICPCQWVLYIQRVLNSADKMSGGFLQQETGHLITINIFKKSIIFWMICFMQHQLSWTVLYILDPPDLTLQLLTFINQLIINEWFLLRIFGKKEY